MHIITRASRMKKITPGTIACVTILHTLVSGLSIPFWASPTVKTGGAMANTYFWLAKLSTRLRDPVGVQGGMSDKAKGLI